MTHVGLLQSRVVLADKGLKQATESGHQLLLQEFREGLYRSLLGLGHRGENAPASVSRSRRRGALRDRCLRSSKYPQVGGHLPRRPLHAA